MQFKVPQFLDIEDKIFGPFTFSQFVYLAGGAGICFILYKTLGLLLGILPMLLIAGFSLALTFYRPNNKPFLSMVQSAISYYTQDKLYIWKRKDKRKITNDELRMTNGINLPEVNGVKLTGSKLRDLAWSLDVLDSKKNDSFSNLN